MPMPSTTAQLIPGAGTPAPAPLMELRGVKQHYPVHRHLPIGPRNFVKALDGIDLSVAPAETVGVIGESGCGKSTLARVMSGLEKPTEGQVLFRGQDINGLKGDEKREMRRNIQLIFQDPYSSLNPRMTVQELVGEPFEIHPEVAPRPGRKAKIKELLEMVGLNPDHADRYRRLSHHYPAAGRDHLSEHVALSEAVVNRQAALADELIRAHLARTVEILLADDDLQESGMDA